MTPGPGLRPDVTARHGGRGGAVVLLVAVLLGVLLPATALADSRHATQPARSSTLARIELTDMSPRVVTTAGAPVLRVSGRVVNIGDRPLTQLGVRLQRDDPLTSDDAASTAIRSVPEALYVTRFRPIPGDLAPGQSSPFQLDVPLRGGGELESLQINEPGVYPLLVNVNGKPEYGGIARLASVPLLLPVLSLPPLVPGDGPGPGPPPPASPIPLTVLWPLAVEPVRLPTDPGEPILIAGDSSGGDPMAVQLAPGGRLDGLVGALEQVVPPGSPLAVALCVVIDPLLLETVDGMSRGYRVAHPGGGISEGTGVQDARSWLERLRAAVQGRCVLPLPYADPDLVALSRAGLTDLQELATGTGTRLVRNLLQVQPLIGVSWPPDGVLDERTLVELTALHTRAVLLAPSGVATTAPLGGVVGLAAPGIDAAAPVGVLVDPLLAGALNPEATVLESRGPDSQTPDAGRPDSIGPDATEPGPTGGRPTGRETGGLGLTEPYIALLDDPASQSARSDAGVPQVTGPDLLVPDVLVPDVGAVATDGDGVIADVRPADTPRPLAAQDGLGVLVYRAIADPDPEPVLLVPPRRWQAGGAEATELLRTAARLLEDGFVVPRELTELTDTPPADPLATVHYAEQAGSRQIPPSVTSDVGQARDMVAELQTTAVRDATTDLQPTDLLDPLRLGLLRGMSSAWRGRPDHAAWLTMQVQRRLEELRESVRIVQAPGPYTLASSNSPLLITVSNELPVAMRVKLNLSQHTGLRTGAVDVALIPARSTRQFVIPAEVSRAGRFSVGVRLSTPTGTSLGRPSTLHLRSTAFGTITIALTAGAGVVLVVLVARRIVRRVRGARKAG